MKKILLGCFVLILFACQRRSAVQITKAPEELRVLTYNIRHASPPSKPELIDIDAIARVIKETNPDIVALQEVDRNTARSGNIDEAGLLGEKTGLQYHFYKAIDHDGGEYGLAILSRFPLEHIKLIPLPQQVKAENRILSMASFKIGKQEIVFANTHLDATRTHENRIVQMQEILQTFEHVQLPVILCGDLNSVAGSEPINLLDTKFKRTCTDNCEATVPQDKPRRTIDFIATRNADWPLLKHEVIPETYASDHRPVLAVFKLSGN